LQEDHFQVNSILQINFLKINVHSLPTSVNILVASVSSYWKFSIMSSNTSIIVYKINISMPLPNVETSLQVSTEKAKGKRKMKRINIQAF